VVDTTVQPKAIAHPTDARLCHRALEIARAGRTREILADSTEIQRGFSLL
jgi:hypothetical protein